jgi:hypothetical protein
MEPAASSNLAPVVSGRNPARPIRPVTAERTLLAILAGATALFVGIAIGIAVGILLVVLFTSPRISQQGYRSIEQGMSRAAVENLLGPPGDYTTGATDSESTPAATDLWSPDALGSRHAARWEGDEATIHVAFDDAGRVIGKS